MLIHYFDTEMSHKYRQHNIKKNLLFQQKVYLCFYTY